VQAKQKLDAKGAKNKPAVAATEEPDAKQNKENSGQILVDLRFKKYIFDRKDRIFQ
jgi:hypothetical protein